MPDGQASRPADREVRRERAELAAERRELAAEWESSRLSKLQKVAEAGGIGVLPFRPRDPAYVN